MRTRILFLSVLLLTLSVSRPAEAQQTHPPAPAQPDKAADVWKRINDRGAQAMESGDYITAEKLFRESLAYAEQHNLGTGDIAESNLQLGWSLRSQGRPAEAEVAYRSALQMYRSLYAENDESVVQSKVRLGFALVDLGQYQEAESLLLESLDAYDAQPSVTACALSFPLDGLTMLYKASRQYQKGERIYMEVFSLMTGTRGVPCEHFETLLDHLAELYSDDNQWDFVEKLQRSRAGLVLGMEGPHSELYGDALYALAEALVKRRRWDEAAAQYAQAADAYRHVDPPVVSKVAASLESQEMYLNLAGKTEEARRLHPAVQAALEEDRAGDPRGVMLSLRSRAVEARESGNLEEAGKLVALEVAASRKLSAGDQMIALNDSASIHREQQMLPEAEADLKQALALAIQTTGPTSLVTADAYFALGNFYADDRPAEAAESFAAALALYPQRDTDRLRNALGMLGRMYLAAGQLDQALPIYQRAVKLAEDTQDDTQMAFALQSLAELYQKSHRLAEAEAALNRAMNITQGLPKPMNRQWVAIAMSAASFYQQTGRPQQAEQLYLRIIAMLEEQYGANVVSLRLPLDGLIGLLKTQGRLAEAAKYQAREDKLPAMPPMPGAPH